MNLNYLKQTNKKASCVCCEVCMTSMWLIAVCRTGCLCFVPTVLGSTEHFLPSIKLYGTMLVCMLWSVVVMSADCGAVMPSATRSCLCSLGQISLPLSTSFFSSIKRGVKIVPTSFVVSRIKGVHTIKPSEQCLHEVIA